MQIIGDYEYNPQDKLGSGWYGVVYKGRSRTNPSVTVAIKSIKVKRSGSNVNKIVTEMAIMKQIHHENIVSLFDCYEQGKYVFFIMEYCNGGDLASYLDLYERLDENTIRIFLIQLADGMRTLSAKGIIHRDLKPKNILITSNVSNPHPSQMTLKIADFGLARFLEYGETADTLCGTPFYMAPEVFRRWPYDAKADIWSLGAIVFKCLTGKRPFHYQLFFAINKGAKIMQRYAASAVLTDLLTRMLERDPNQRINFEQFFYHQFLRQPIGPPM